MIPQTTVVADLPHSDEELTLIPDYAAGNSHARVVPSGGSLVDLCPWASALAIHATGAGLCLKGAKGVSGGRGGLGPKGLCTENAQEICPIGGVKFFSLLWYGGRSMVASDRLNDPAWVVLHARAYLQATCDGVQGRYVGPVWRTPLRFCA